MVTARIRAALGTMATRLMSGLDDVLVVGKRRPVDSDRHQKWVIDIADFRDLAVPPADAC
jgi:hypothetical protein